LECLYFDEPGLADAGEKDPNYGYLRDAATHLSSYQLIQSDSEMLREGALGEEWKRYSASLTQWTFRTALHSYIRKHNKRVEDFSIWESESISSMASEASLRVNYSQTPETSVPLETVDKRNLVRHLEDQSVAHRRSLELVRLKIEPVGWFLHSTLVGVKGKGNDFQIAWSEKLENVEKLKKLVEGFASERAERIEALKESARQIEIGHEVLVRNLQVVMKEMDSGIFRGTCETEKALLVG
jgi:hypothetical protein